MTHAQKMATNQHLNKVPGSKAYHTGRGAPNPWFVEMFALEKKVDIFTIANNLDVGKAQNRNDPRMQELNPAGGVPFMEFDDGSCISETVSICNLIDDTAPGGPTMTGKTPQEKAFVSMWLRRVEQHIILPFYNHFRWGPAKKMFATRGMHGMLASDEAAAQQLQVAKNQLEWLDGLMVKAGSPDYICGAKYGITINDIMLYTQLEFWDAANKGVVKKEWFPSLKWVPGWFESMHSRPAAEESKKWNGSHDLTVRTRLLLQGKLDNVESKGRVELSQLAPAERYTGNMGEAVSTSALSFLFRSALSSFRKRSTRKLLQRPRGRRRISPG
jgi:glutathione S-transferase